MRIRIFGGIMAEKEKNFGSTIKKLRKENKLTQEMLSQGICAQSVLSRIESGEEIPNVIVLQELCRRLNVTIDQVMQSQPEKLQKVTKIFNRVRFLFIHHNYTEVQEVLNESKVLDLLYLDTDFQIYYYYEGSCIFYLDKDYENAIQSLKKGLAYTYTKGKSNVSAMEVHMMSCLGYIYLESGNMQKAGGYLEHSYQLMQELPIGPASFELTKVFYHYAYFLFLKKDYQKSLEMCQNGIRWVQDCCSYYYLKELFLLASQVGQAMNNQAVDEGYFSLYQLVEKIDPEN